MKACALIAIQVRRLVLRRDRWRVDTRIVNHTGSAAQVSRSHHANQARFGVAVFETNCARCLCLTDEAPRL